MRIKVIGESDCARAARGLLRKAGFAVTEFLPAAAVTSAAAESPLAGYVIYIEESHEVLSAGTGPIRFDSVDCELEANILRHVTALSSQPVVVDRPGGVVHSDREIRIVVPRDNPGEQQAVELGVLRGLLDTMGGPVRAARGTAAPGPRVGRSATSGFREWWKRLTRVGAVLVVMLAGFAPDNVGIFDALAAPTSKPTSIVLERRTPEARLRLSVRPQGLFAQLQGAGTFTNLAQIGGAVVSASLYDAGNTALKVNCVVGCSASAGFTDGTAFTAGTSAISNIGGVFNDALAAVTAGSAAAPRITAQRGWHVNLRSAGGTELASAAAAPVGTELGLIVRNIPSGTQTVAGTVTGNQGAALAQGTAGWPTNPWGMADTLFASGSVTAPAAGAAIATLTNPPAGTYLVYVVVNAGGDQDNAEFRIGATARLTGLGGAALGASSTVYGPFRVGLNGVTSLSINATAAGGVGLVYAAQIWATRIF